MTRAVGVVLLAWWLALALLDFAWWAPAILLALLALAAEWARTWATLALLDVLDFAGRHEAARALALAAAARCRRRLRGMGRG